MWRWAVPGLERATRVDLDAPGVDALIVGRARQGAVEVEARLGDGRHALVPEGVEGLASHPYSLASGLRCDTFLTGDAG